MTQKIIRMRYYAFLIFYKVPKKLRRLVRSTFYSFIFKTRNSSIGIAPKINGISHIKLGDNFSAGNYLWLEAVTSFNEFSYSPEIDIGPNFNCSDFVHIGCIDKVEIGRGVLIGSKVLITDHSHGRYHGNQPAHPRTEPNRRPLYSKGPVVIGDNVFIGDNCCIQSGVSIGSGAIIAANSIVSKNIPANTLAFGVPAEPIKKYCEKTQTWVSSNIQNTEHHE